MVPARAARRMLAAARSAPACLVLHTADQVTKVTHNRRSIQQDIRMPGDHEFNPVPIDFSGAHPSGAAETERVRKWPLWLLGLVGVASVVGAIYLDVVRDVENIAPSLLLELGAGVFLFAFLFWAERRIVIREVRRQTRALVEALTYSPEQQEAMAEDPELGTLESRFGEEGQIGVALRFVGAAADGRYEDAWELADDNWKLCRAEAFLWNNRNFYGDDQSVLDRLAAEITAGPSDAEVWEEFVETERGQYVQTWGDIDVNQWGAASRRRRIAPDYELVILTPLGKYETGFMVHGLTALPAAVTLVMHRTSHGFRVASHVAEAPPIPGWPPSWWVRNDPAVNQLPED